MAEEEHYSREAFEAASSKKDHQVELAWDEALKLNKEYDELWAQKETTEQAVADFQRDKLGMNRGQNKEREVAEQEKPERTRESEILANLKFLRELGIEVDEDAVRAEFAKVPEEEGLDWFHVIPVGEKNSGAFKKMMGRFPCWGYRSPEELDEIQMPRTANQLYVVAMRHSQEPDEDSLGENAKSALQWEETGKQFATPLERMFAEMRWVKETGKHLDEKNVTLCPGSRDSGGEVPDLYFDSGNGKVYLDSDRPEDRNPGLGVRRVVSSKIES